MVDVEGAPNSIYAGEKFQLRFKFNNRYPFDSPEVSVNKCDMFTQNGSEMGHKVLLILKLLYLDCMSTESDTEYL